MDDTPPDDTPRKKREPAQGDLRGLIGRWMEEYGQDRLDLVYALQQMLTEVLAGLHANYTWRLRRIEQVLELPAHGGEVDGVSSLFEGGDEPDEDAP